MPAETGAQFVSNFAPPAPPANSPDSGFSIFGWHPSLPNLGGITAVKQLASGFLALPEQAYNIGQDIYHGDVGQLNPLNPTGDVGKIVGGIGQGVENLATSASGVIGVPFTRYNLGDEVVSPLLQEINKFGPQPPSTDANGNPLPAFKPSSIWARPGGPIAGAVQDISTAALVAGPVSSAVGAAAETAKLAATASAADAASAAGAADAVAGTAASTGAEAEAASTAATAAKAAARADRLSGYADVAHNFAHPYQYLGARAADVVLGARDIVRPPTFEMPPELETAPQVLARKAQGQEIDPQALSNAIVSAVAPEHMTSEAAAASNVATATEPLSPLQQAMNEAAAAEEAKGVNPTTGLSAEPPAVPGTTRLYRVGEPGGEWYTEGAPSEARATGTRPEDLGRRSYVDVPDEVAKTLPRGPNGEISLGEHPDLMNAAKEYQPPLTGQAKAAATRAAAAEAEAGRLSSTVEEERAPEVAAARAAVTPSDVAQKLALRLATPAPAWAQNLVQHLPPVMNRAIASFAGPIEKWRFNNLARDYGRIVEVSQHNAQVSPAVQAMKMAAQTIVEAVPGSDRWDLSHIVGEEVGKVATGATVVEQFIHDGGDPEVADALRLTATRGFQGLPKELSDAMTVEQKHAFQDQINAAAAAMKGVEEHHRQLLLASRPGMQGIERALLGDTGIPMSNAELKLYRQAMQELRLQKIKEARADDLDRRLQADVAKKELEGEKQSAEADRLAAQVGVLERSLPALHDSVPKALRDENIDAAADTILREATQLGGTVFDVGRNETNLPHDGVFVNMAHQGDVAVDPNNLAAAHDQLKQIMQHPIQRDGTPYDIGIHSSPDARLTVTPHTDPTTGAVTLSVDLGMGTWGGRALPQWLATGLGEMWRQTEGYNAATGEAIHFSGQEAVQNLWAHYSTMALDQQSPFYKFAEGLRKSAEAQGIPAEDVDAALRFYMTKDYAMSRALPGQWKLGDLFAGAKWGTGKYDPKTDFLGQTVLDLTTKEGIDAALSRPDVAAVNDYLRWYYDSHDYIELGYRNHNVTLLDGSVRNAAEVFYDLLAVTSVMADPATNLGRSLMALANLGEFHDTHADSFAAAQALMDKLESISPEERGTLNGTVLSKRFLTKEVMKLTSGTSMTNQPKYNVFDVLSGRLNLETATNRDIANLPDFWTGDPKKAEEDMMSRTAIVNALDEQGITGPGADAYRDWAVRMDQHEGDLAEMGDRQYEPITATQNEDTGTGLNQSREVSPGEFEVLAREGGESLQARRDNGAPIADLTAEPIIRKAFKDSKPEWGGSTLDAHTLQYVAKGEDTYSVTVRPQGVASEAIPIGSDYATFKAAYLKAVKQFGPTLEMDGGHLGVFHNVESGKIEFDPNIVTPDVHEVEAIGAASHSNGGAFHFGTELGYWIPHIKDEFATPETADVHTQALEAERADILARNPEIEAARQQALLEWHGSNVLGKMRNFRSNLADPHGSIGVTLDSVMARMYGFSENRWSEADAMGVKSREVRDQAHQWSALANRTVMPHELQAAMWIHTKLEIGRQDFGRMLAHLDIAQEDLDSFAARLASGKKLTPTMIAKWDPFKDWHEENLGYSRQALADRRLLKDLNARFKADPTSLTAEELDKRMELKSSNLRDEVHNDTVQWTPPRPKAQMQKGKYTRSEATDRYRVQRFHIPFDAGKLGDKEEAYRDSYLPRLAKWRAMLKRGDIEGVRKDMVTYVNQARKSVEGDAGAPFPNVAEASLRNPKTSTYRAVQNMRNGLGGMPAPDQWGADTRRGSVDELNQRVNGRLRGALLLKPDQASRLTIRLFEGANLGTLVHEGGHLLRQMLPPEMVERLARNPGYAHLLDATLTPARIAAEEKFTADLMYYIRRSVRTGAHDGPLSDVFEKLAATLEEQHAAMRDHAYGRTFSPDIGDFFDRLFHPTVDPKTPLEDPLSMRRVNPQGVETKQFRWESDAEFARRARQYGEARANLAATQARQALAARGAARADAAARKMAAAMTTEPNEIRREAIRLGKHASAILEKLGRSMETPNREQVPREWRDMWDGFQELAKQAKDNPELAEYLDEIPTTWTQVLQEAAARGFEPTYLPDMTWEQAQRGLFSHVRLGQVDVGTQPIANVRKENKGVLARNALRDRSIESLAGGTMAATHELYSSELVNFIEKYWMRPFQSGATVPEGWVPWDADRQWILNGTRADREAIAVGANGIIPVEVSRAIKSMSQQYDHWAFHTLTRVTNPWITYNLTLSPKWYLHVAISNVVRGLAEGVRPREWITAIKQWKTGTVPPEVLDHGINTLLRDGNHTLLGSTIKEAKQNEGMRSALHEVRGRISKVHDVMDQVSRAAVFEHTLNKTGSRAAALTRSFEAMVDYGNLSPLERALTRSVIPFYPFYKGMVKLLVRFPADHPAATGLLMMMGRMHQEYMQDQFGGPVPDAYRGVANIFGLHNFTILDPFINPTNLVDIHNINSTLNPYVDIMLRDAYNAAEPGTGEKAIGPTGQAVTQVNVAKALGADISGAPASRLIGDLFTGGDVYKKNPGVAGGIAQYLGAPTTPNVANVQANVAKAQGLPAPAANGGAIDQATIDQLVQKALAKAPRKASAPRTTQQKLVSALVKAHRPPKAKGLRIYKPRSRTLKPRVRHYGYRPKRFG